MVLLSQVITTITNRIANMYGYGKPQTQQNLLIKYSRLQDRQDDLKIEEAQGARLLNQQ